MAFTPFIERNIVWLYTGDLGRLAGFCRDVMGLPPVLGQGVRRVFQVSPTRFPVEDLDTAYAQFKARGLPFEAPPDLSPGRPGAGRGADSVPPRAAVPVALRRNRHGGSGRPPAPAAAIPGRAARLPGSCAPRR